MPSGILAELQVNELYGNAPGGYNNIKSETHRAKDKTVQGKLDAYLVEWGRGGRQREEGKSPIGFCNFHPLPQNNAF